MPFMRALLRRLLTTTYAPEASAAIAREAAVRQESPLAEVAVAVLDGPQSRRVFGVDLAGRRIQPVHVRIHNRSDRTLRLQLTALDPNYFTALEAASICRFSFGRRLAAFGAAMWWFAPLVVLAPFKMISAHRANRRMTDVFRGLALRLRPIQPGAVAEGFVFTTADYGTKEVKIRLLGGGATAEEACSVDFDFSIPVDGLTADHHRRDLDAIAAAEKPVHGDRARLLAAIEAMPQVTTNARGTGTGDPVNLVIVGDADRILSAFAGRWDETESITFASCRKTARAFLLGTEYRYSPVSPLYLFSRSQDLALQRIRRSIHERLHLRLWLSPLRFEGQPVFVGQVSRDIGVRFTHRTWTLTTHAIDADVDEARDYVMEDLFEAERIRGAGYVGGVGACDRAHARHNLCGDPWFTDGKRAVIVLSEKRVEPGFLKWE